MLEKRGVIDQENTRPEKPGEKDLEQHLTKRAAAKIEKLVVPNVKLTEEQRRRFQEANENLSASYREEVVIPIEKLSAEDREEVLRNGWAESPIGGSVGNTAGLNRIKLDR
jgi:DNA repair photolyase